MIPPMPQEILQFRLMSLEKTVTELRERVAILETYLSSIDKGPKKGKKSGS